MTHFSLHRSLAAAVVATGVAFASTASAQQAGGASNCPPGSWFCESSPAAPTPAASGSSQLQQLPPAEAKPASSGAGPGTPPPPPPPPNGGAPPVVVYQPGPPVVVIQRPDKPPPYLYAPRPAEIRPRREWGLNLHLQGALLGSNSSNDSGMGGLGLGLRFRPHPVIAIEPSIDFYGGRDYNGFRRSETAFTMSALLFATPHAKFVQLYFPVGFGWSGARVTDDTGAYDRHMTYSYFGMHAGVGLEFRLARHFALNTDVRGFIRGRTDDNAGSRPEFVSADGRATNTSGGALFTGGMTFYF